MNEEKLQKSARHKFPSGDKWNGNRNGRPRAPEVEELRKALDKAKKENNKSFLDHFVQRAFRDDTVAIALAKKILPDKMVGEVDLNFPDIVIHLNNGKP